MTDIVIQAEHLSKQYRLGTIGSGTLYRDLQSWWARLCNKEDPNIKLGQWNPSQLDGEHYFWALKDVSFDIQQGEAVGIIGRNGAGKSTLLKILSRVTGPTGGQIKIKGRVASLLEVGTGFHPELTGRENVYLNGTILGMRKSEIDHKFDEIVDFAEISKFIDTPVKRYSSGMYVRLAFAVAAHLDPEILIVDEVLAVGDAAFQKKCLGKMGDVGRKGVTVLFVSHNMPMITALCSKAILLDRGQIVTVGSSSSVVQQYYSYGGATQANIDFNLTGVLPGDDVGRLCKARIINSSGEISMEHRINEPIILEMEYRILKEGARVNPNLHFYTADGTYAFATSDVTIDRHAESKQSPGLYKSKCVIPPNLLNTGTYYVSFALSTMTTSTVHFYEKDLLSFTVVESIYDSITRGEYVGAVPGIVRPLLQWECEIL